MSKKEKIPYAWAQLQYHNLIENTLQSSRDPNIKCMLKSETNTLITKHNTLTETGKQIIFKSSSYISNKEYKYNYIEKKLNIEKEYNNKLPIYVHEFSYIKENNRIVIETPYTNIYNSLSLDKANKIDNKLKEWKEWENFQLIELKYINQDEPDKHTIIGFLDPTNQKLYILFYAHISNDHGFKKPILHDFLATKQFAMKGTITSFFYDQV